MADEIRLVPRTRGDWYDVWLGDTQLPETVNLNDCGDLAPLVYDEIGRRLLRQAREREGLV
jgi:hypothetical protein